MQGKRPQMGAVAAQLADRVVVTSDNPRSERPGAIIDAVVAGIAASGSLEGRRRGGSSGGDRAGAQLASPGDVVVVAGKGHETTQTIGAKVVPFDDRAVVRRLLEQPNVIAVMIAGVVAGVLSLVITRLLISAFGTRGLGQPILGKEDHGPEHHMAKQGTPTMGGLAILAAAFVGWVVAHVTARPAVLGPGADRVDRHHRRWRSWGSSTTSSRSAGATTAGSSGSRRTT